MDKRSHSRFPKLDGLALASAREPKNFRGDCVQGQNAMGEPGLGHSPGHSPDGAGGLVLSEDGAAVFADDAAAGQAVVTHAGEDDGQDARTVDLTAVRKRTSTAGRQ
jgi:hypothetical protein